jgi:hypothetical protein
MNRLSSLPETRENYFGMVQMGKTLAALNHKTSFTGSDVLVNVTMYPQYNNNMFFLKSRMF